MSDKNYDEGANNTPRRPTRRRRRSSSGNREKTPRKKTNQGLTPDDLVKIISALQNTPSKNISTTNVIPEFDPNNRSQDVDRWLKKVNECSIIYNWDEKQTIHYALQKLCGLAKSWYESLPSLNYSWEAWQSKLKKAFPNDINFGKLLDEMLNRKSRNDETLRDYFYDKLSLLSRCEIVGRKAVDCIIYGIVDSSVRNGAQALKCDEPEDLLNYLASQQLNQSKDSNNLRGLVLNSNPSRRKEFRNNNSQNENPNRSVESICYNCHERGHVYQNCSKPLLKCVKCHRVGHNTDSCGRKLLQVREVDGQNQNTVEDNNNKQ